MPLPLRTSASLSLLRHVCELLGIKATKPGFCNSSYKPQGCSSDSAIFDLDKTLSARDSSHAVCERGNGLWPDLGNAYSTEIQTSKLKTKLQYRPKQNPCPNFSSQGRNSTDGEQCMVHRAGA